MAGEFYGRERVGELRQEAGLTPVELYELLLSVWCAETCAPRMRQDWTPEDPTLGQCSVTAFLVQDLFGGEVLGIPLEEGGVHCYNRVRGVVFDLTSEQFGARALSYEGNPLQHREEHFAKGEKLARYRLLRRRLLGELAVWLKHRGHNCCQAVLCAYAREVGQPAGLLRRMGAGFGVGMGCMEATCGALCAAQMLLGLRAYEGRPLLGRARSLVAAFEEKCGATLCWKLKGRDTGEVLCDCDDCVRRAVETVEEAGLFAPEG